MDGKEAIIADIIEKAEKSAAGLLSAAQAERDAALEKVRNEERRKQEAALSAARENADVLLARRKTLGELDARKTELAAKQQVVDMAFEEAAKKLLNMTDHIYREFVGALVAEYADDGDCVIVAERDEKRLHEEWLHAVSKQCGKTLTLSSAHHAGRAGVILSGERCDKNLTMEALLADLRERELTSVAKRLFK